MIWSCYCMINTFLSLFSVLWLKVLHIVSLGGTCTGGKQLLCWEFRFWQVRTGIALIPGLLTDEISVPALVSELYSLLTLLLKTSYSSIFTQDFKSALGTTFESFNLLFHDPWEFQKENSIFQNNRELDLLDESLCVFVARMTH